YKEPYEIPFYQQYYGTCASASLLMANSKYGSITNILESYSAFIGENKGVAKVQFCENSTLQFIKHDQFYKCFTEIVSHIITQLAKGPVLFIFTGPKGTHAIVINGYKGYFTKMNSNGKLVGDYNDLIFIAHDPLEGPYVDYSFNKLQPYLAYGDMYTNSYGYEAASKISIHMPDYTTGSDIYHIGGASGVAFKKDDTVVDYIWWDPLSSDGYRLFNSTHNHNTYHENPININGFDTIEFKGIPVYNTEKTNTQYNPSLKLRTRILRNGNEVYTNDSPELIKSGYSYPITNYNVNWKNLRESIGTSWVIGDVFSVCVNLIESTGEGNLKVETTHGNFNFSFTSK
ncbi:MAG TPA: hypothetical protein PK467_04785, partial [Candidatus Wallbacteria bacterium]|nr:hypothetical protein [Candidatus Wallbacteria bacterium]